MGEDISWLDVSKKLLRKAKQTALEEEGDIVSYGKDVEAILKKNLNDFAESEDMDWRELGQHMKNEFKDYRKKRKEVI